jgi:hypothetical protein
MPVAPLPIPNDTPPKPRRRSRRPIILLSILLLLAAPFLAYATLAVRFYTGKPNPTHNYYAELNALRDQYTEDQRAWGLYLAMRPRLRALQDQISESSDQIAADHGIDEDEVPHAFDARPGDPFFETSIRAATVSGLLDEIRQAARRPIIGTLFTDRFANDPPTTIEDFLPPSPDPADHDMLALELLQPLGYIRDAAKLLELDTHAAAATGDTDRVIANIRDLIAIARQAEREPGLLPDLVAMACVAIATDTTNEVLAQPVLQFSDQQLERLTNIFWDDAIPAAVVDFSHERTAQQDLLQRIYTDDGAGSGRITPDGYTWFRMLTGALPDVPKPLNPILAVLIADRAEQAASFDEGIRLAEALVKNPADHYPAWVARHESLFRPNLVNRYRLALTNVMEPALAKCAQTQIQTRTRVLATATRLALERHKLAHNHYPDTLDRLLPTYLPELPADPFNPGHPIKYLLRDNQPILYSVGANGVDNQATPAPRNADAANLEARFADPNGPSPDAPEADWILSPSQD